MISLQLEHEARLAGVNLPMSVYVQILPDFAFSKVLDEKEEHIERRKPVYLTFSGAESC